MKVPLVENHAVFVTTMRAEHLRDRIVRVVTTLADALSALRTGTLDATPERSTVHGDVETAEHCTEADGCFAPAAHCDVGQAEVAT